jgi:hypothetical protein
MSSVVLTSVQSSVYGNIPPILPQKIRLSVIGSNRGQSTPHRPLAYRDPVVGCGTSGFVPRT